MTLATIPEVLAALRAGTPVIVADDEGRENEGDAIMAAEHATKEWVAWMVRHTSGYLCAPMPNHLADRLELPLMTTLNQDTRGTAYTVSVDAANRVSTGISASDRAETLRTLADPTSTPTALIRPGHILPLRAVDGGVRVRGGHTEATVELMKLAGLHPVGVIGELVEDSGDMMRMPSLLRLGAEYSLPVTTVQAIIDWLDSHSEPPAPLGSDSEARVRFEVETLVPTVHGSFRMRAYRDQMTGADHVAIISGNPGQNAFVRVHSECLTGEAFGSLKCECGPQLQEALNIIHDRDGVVVYLRGHEGRAIGLVNKLRAYELQEEGLDTVDANVALGLPIDSRDYGAAVAILKDLGLEKVKLLTNNPEKSDALTERGIEVSERIPLIVGIGDNNRSYLKTKRDRMGHALSLAHDSTGDPL
ncbi:GTP cyclohydrolase II [Homoserinimonas sp. OAct 916]|uniref:GTP cyclohydrolase II n=1 Tax=Homoserinimonas sp. OAct 916 TaxID=2211450 RepID=UPI000DBE561A|nr:GTP cyclohydrolase II [Homoserinimonas sp. OAct 916]